MKKFTIFLTLWLLLLSLVYILYSEDNESVEKKASKIDLEISSLTEKFGDRIYRSFYSIEELRPFSIVQIDKILEMYDNTWLSPNLIMEMLTDEDKTILKANIIQYVESFNDEKKSAYIISKINSWCKADMQFAFINIEMGIFQDNIMSALQNVNIDKQLIFKYNNTKSAIGEKLSKEQLDFAYYQTLNLISAMTVPDQLRYYGDLYNQLAKINSN